MARHFQLTDELQEKASLYAAGAMPEAERVEYTRHLEDDDCAVCRKEAEELLFAAHSLGLGGRLETPSARVKEQFMRQVHASLPAPRPQPRERRWFASSAALLAVAASIALIVVLRDNTRLRGIAESLTTRVSQLEAQIGEQRVRLATLTSPQVRIVTLAGQGANGTSSGRIFWDQAGRRWLFYAENLPPLPNNKSYQLWFVPASGDPVSAGVFNTTANGNAEIRVEVPRSLTNIKAAAVTTEPAGGLEKPSGAFALLGEIE
jgi:hypothetical protein